MKLYLSNTNPNTGISPSGPFDTQYGSLVTSPPSSTNFPLTIDGLAANLTEVPFGAIIPDGSFGDFRHYGNSDARTLNQPIVSFPDNGGRTTPLPNTLLPIGKWAWRTPAKLNLVFTRGIWTFNLRTNVGMSNSDTLTEATFSVTARVFKGSAADGSDAVEITNQLMTSTPVTVSGAGATVNAAFQDFTVSNGLHTQRTKFDNEYLFINFALKVGHFDIASTTTGHGISIYPVRSQQSYLITPAVGADISEDICRPFGQHEMYLYITPDGETYPLDVDGRRVVLNDEGTGTPPYEYITQRGPFQHGESLTAVYAKPRVLQLMIMQRYDNRDSYWNGRRNLLGVLSPRRQAIDGNVDLGVLRRILSTGEKRDLKCLITEGPKFEPRHEDSWQELSYTETLRFTAFDPIYYDPTVQSYIFDQQGSQLVFPIVFPIRFETILQDVTLNYNGTWLTYPTFTITGPMTYFHIVNETTGEQIDITYDLAAGETITIALAYGSKSVTKNDGTNLLPYVSGDSDLGTFHITEASLGVNQLHVHMVGVTSTSQIEMTWNDRYVGI
jgi:hypothetical protein